MGAGKEASILVLFEGYLMWTTQMGMQTGAKKTLNSGVDKSYNCFLKGYFAHKGKPDIYIGV